MTAENYKEQLHLSSIKIVVLDMDGTLYNLIREDTEDEISGYKGSKLAQAVRENAIKFLSERTDTDEEQSTQIINDLITNHSPLSIFMQQNFNVSSEKYFDEIWNIDPKDIILSSHQWGNTIADLRDSGIEVILLTAAPRVWTKNVFSTLGLRVGDFENVFTAEQHFDKGEILDRIIADQNPRRIISIGDQYESDILPALERGCQIKQVNSPEDTWKILNDILDQTYQNETKTNN